MVLARKKSATHWWSKLTGSKSLWRILFGGIFLSGILAISDIPKIAAEKEFSLMQPKWLLLLIGLAALAFVAGTLFALTWTKFYAKIEASFDAFLRLSAKFKWFFAPVLLLVFFGVTALEVQPYLSQLFGSHYWTKVFFFQIFVFLGAFALQSFFPSLSLAERFSLLALGQLFIYYFPSKFGYFTNSPFAIGWTSDSRHYYASLFAAQKLYGQQLPLPILHPSLHLLLSIPFFLGRFPIIVHRLWGIFLTWGLGAGVAWALLRRNPAQKKLHRVLLGIWVFLYLVRGSIYVHLLLPTLLIFLFLDSQKQKRSWLVVILASLWAGISRINWFPVPAMLAVLIYLLETPQSERKLFDYLKLPVAWFIVGVGSAFVAQAAYIHSSGNGARDEFYTSLASDLLWFRLLPNTTYRPGIILGALFLSLPLLIFVGQYLYRYRRNWNFIRVLGIVAIVGVLFAGGLLVSTKIGGGADLHNMDAYFVSLALVAGIVYARGFTPDSVSERMRGELSFPIILLALVSLAGMLLPGGGSLPRPNWDWERSSFDGITAQITSVSVEGQDVLFIAQRNFVTFGLVDVPLIPDYEKDVLMEMAMARNDAYLDEFALALKNHEFGLIVIDPQSNVIQPEKAAFALENNRWVREITQPLMCYYELVTRYDDVSVELYAPRSENLECDEE
jgi:hypothetical protein